MGQFTVNLLIALSTQDDLRCAGFPTDGIPEIPRPRLPQLNPEVRRAIMQIYHQQQCGLQTLGLDN